MKQKILVRCRLFLSVLMIGTMIVCAAPQGYALGKDSYKDATKSVVAIMSTDNSLNQIENFDMGSGFGVGTPGKPTNIFVTNRHVVVNEKTNSLYKYVYIVLEDGAITTVYNAAGHLSAVNIQQDQLVRCEVLYPKADDPEFPDVAILRTESVVQDRIALPLKSGFEMSAGDKVYTMGFPSSADTAMKLEQTESGAQIAVSASTDSVTVADGVISRTVTPAEFNETTVFQHTAAMNHGNSGGPLVDEEGYAVGINTYGFNQAENGVAEYKASIYIDYAMQKLDGLGQKYSEGNFGSFWLWIAIATIAVAVIVIVSVILHRAKKPKKRAAYRLQSVSGPFGDRRFAIEGQLCIGRDPARCDLVFPSEATQISGAHCLLELKGDELKLTDLGSRNGTFVNGEQLAARVPKILRPGDTLCMATEKYRFRIDVSDKKK